MSKYKARRRFFRHLRDKGFRNPAMRGVPGMPLSYVAAETGDQQDETRSWGFIDRRYFDPHGEVAFTFRAELYPEDHEPRLVIVTPLQMPDGRRAEHYLQDALPIVTHHALEEGAIPLAVEQWMGRKPIEIAGTLRWGFLVYREAGAPPLDPSPVGLG